jgi:hypothetical protein
MSSPPAPAPAPLSLRLPDPDCDHTALSVGRFELEQYLCDELPVERRQAIEEALRNDPALRALHDELVAEDRAALALLPPAALVARVQEKGPGLSVWQRLRRLTLVGVPVLSAAAVLVLLARGPDGDPDLTGPTRSKGAGLSFVVQDNGGARAGVAGEALRQGDRIQLAVGEVPGANHLVIVGVDGRGEVSVYDDSPLLSRRKGGGLQVLPRSLTLDDAVGTERFFAVFAVAEDDAARAALLEAVQAAAARVAQAGGDLATTERLEVRPKAAVRVLAQHSVFITKVP